MFRKDREWHYQTTCLVTYSLLYKVPEWRGWGYNSFLFGLYLFNGGSNAVDY